MTYRSLYSAAKSAVNSLTANLRMDLRQSHPGISVSLVLPGAVATDFVKNAIGGTPQPVKTKIQTAEEVADLMVALIHNPQPELYTNFFNEGKQIGFLLVRNGNLPQGWRDLPPN